ncbi:putative Phenylacetate-coenzyme A ligase [uncultured Desulfobacterium sp.]|uniref:Putative Phenylacetate-coenzyme A ligase n=1 Tax=uncultured Desulfobacterium sp. TaxID=201089 RepID=A0A445MR08_9BACT|nr:putative Phenylacetate-coenzyme A ligase [uncultured Desulfobacterium sp.]
MSSVKFLFTEENVGKRHGVYPDEEQDRTKPYSEKFWSKVETLPIERIREIQMERFRNIVQFAYARSPFYRRIWDNAGIKPEDIRGWDDIRHIPIVTKYDFGDDQKENPPYGTAFTSPPNTQLKYWQTSGTTAKPRLWTETKEDWENGIFLYSRGLYAHGIRPGWRGFFGFSYPPFIAFWLCHSACESMGCQIVPKGPLSTKAWLGLIKNLSTTGVDSFLAATPTFTMRHVEMAEELGINLKELNIKVLTMAGEPGACVPSTKKYLENAWAAKAHDQLGSVETSGPVMYSCAEQAEEENMSDHLNLDSFLVELVDPDTLKPVGDGEPGATVVTALTRFGMPTIRFLLGDWMTISYEKCRCGRTLPLAKGGIKARSDDLIIIKGTNIYPSLIENSVRSIEGLSPEYRIRVKRTNAIVMVEAKPGIKKTDYQKLSKILEEDIRDKTSVRLMIEVNPPGTLPREDVKTKRIIRE